MNCWLIRAFIVTGSLMRHCGLRCWRSTHLMTLRLLRKHICLQVSTAAWQQLADCGQPPSWKNRKFAISRPRFDRFRPNVARRRSSTLLSRPTVKTVKPRRSYGDFSKDGGRRHLGFFKFEIFNGPTALDGRTASPCQIRLKSVKPRPRYESKRRHVARCSFHRCIAKSV